MFVNSRAVPAKSRRTEGSARLSTATSPVAGSGAFVAMVEALRAAAPGREAPK
jgi:hypothetical protein